MSKTSLFSLASVAVLSLGLTSTAGADTVTVLYGQMFSSQAGAVNTSFDSSLSFPSNFTTTGVNVGVVAANTAATFQYSIPTGDTTNYAYVGPGSSLTETFASPIVGFGIYWGSPDTYNTLTITDVNGNSVLYTPGSGVLSSLNPDQSNAAYVDFVDSGAAWASVTLTSSQSAFEFDNLSSVPEAVISTSTVPEPAALSLLAMGLLAVGAGAFRRHKA